VNVVLDKKIPNGPWHAELTLRSGTIVHSVTATITFPDAGGDARLFQAHAAKGKTFWGLLALLLLLAVLLGLLLWWWSRRRREEEDEEEQSTARA
jgi:cbb3-type cytochrome oxidase subunit 3